jgi:hypothetical protein
VYGRSDSKSAASCRGGLIRLPALVDDGLVWGDIAVHVSPVPGSASHTNQLHWPRPSHFDIIEHTYQLQYDNHIAHSRSTLCYARRNNAY